MVKWYLDRRCKRRNSRLERRSKMKNTNLLNPQVAQTDKYGNSRQVEVKMLKMFLFTSREQRTKREVCKRLIITEWWMNDGFFFARASMLVNINQTISRLANFMFYLQRDIWLLCGFLRRLTRLLSKHYYANDQSIVLEAVWVSLCERIVCVLFWW